MFTQTERISLVLVTVCPGSNWVKVRSLVKGIPKSSGRYTPSPKFASGIPVHVVGCITAVRSTTEPRQVSKLSMVPAKEGVVPTCIWRSTTLEFTQPLSSIRFNCTMYSPGAEKEWVAVLVCAESPSSKTHV